MKALLSTSVGLNAVLLNAFRVHVNSCEVLLFYYNNEFFLWHCVFNCFILVYLLQVLCRRHRQYQHHLVCPLHQGKWVLQLTIMIFIEIRICFSESIVGKAHILNVLPENITSFHFSALRTLFAFVTEFFLVTELFCFSISGIYMHEKRFLSYVSIFLK